MYPRQGYDYHVVCVTADEYGRVSLVAALALTHCVRDHRRLIGFIVSVVLHGGSFLKMGIKLHPHCWECGIII